MRNRLRGHRGENRSRPDDGVTDTWNCFELHENKLRPIDCT